MILTNSKLREKKSHYLRIFSLLTLTIISSPCRFLYHIACGSSLCSPINGTERKPQTIIPGNSIQKKACVKHMLTETHKTHNISWQKIKDNNNSRWPHVDSNMRANPLMVVLFGFNFEHTSLSVVSKHLTSMLCLFYCMWWVTLMCNKFNVIF